MQELFTKKFNVDSIIENAKEKDGKDFINFLASVMKEPEKDLISDLYKELGKDFLLGFLEKTLEVENESGMVRKSTKDFLVVVLLFTISLTFSIIVFSFIIEHSLIIRYTISLHSLLYSLSSHVCVGVQ